jgi:hypothetical protein
VAIAPREPVPFLRFLWVSDAADLLDLLNVSFHL